MAGMVPRRCSRGEIERANQELLEKNRTYMQRWLDRALQSPQPAADSEHPNTDDISGSDALDLK